MSRVLVTRTMPAGGLDPLAGHEIVGPGAVGSAGADPLTGRGLAAAVAEVDALLCTLTDRVDATVLDAGATRLRVVANVAVGIDNIDVARAARLGITVCNTPDVLTETTADLAFALVLGAARRLSEAERTLRAGRWAGWDLTGFLGRDVHGATLGLVGYGRIARAVARRAGGFGMRVLHHARHDTGVEGFVADLDDLLRAADIVSVHDPGGDGTHHLVDARRLALLAPHAVLVNTARGTVVDEEALAAALEDGRIFAAGLDVYADEPQVHPRLLAAPRTMLLPHVGSASEPTRVAMARLAATGVADVLAGRRPAHAVAP